MVVAFRRLAGLVVVLLSALPLYRLIRVDRSGPWGEATVIEAGRSYDVGLWGSVSVLGVAFVVAVLSRKWEGRGPLDRLKPAAAALAKVPSVVWAAGCAATALLLASIVATRVFLGLLTNVDEMTSVIHARYLASGQWGGPVEQSAEAWLIPNMLVTNVGWVSQYPPGQLLLLALGELSGVPWAVGPVLLATMVGFSCLAFARVLSTRPVEARLAGAFLAISPFMLLLGGGALSHVSAGAAVSATLYFALRARDGGALWALAAGATTGIAVVCRPWTGLTLGAALTLGPWLHQMLLARRDAERERGDVTLVPRVAYWVLGGIPFAFLLAWYNLRVFGNPFVLGYEVLYGPAHQLGFHLDPWGYPYGVREALAYSSADLARFGVALLDTPVPLTLVAGLALLLAPRLPEGTRTVALWALVPLAANALYWFHQPRMLFEAAPAWMLLAAIGIGLGLRNGDARVRAAVATAIVVSVVVGAWAFVPVRFAGHTWSEETLARITVADPAASAGVASAADGTPALVFVHTSWNERLAGRFQAAGMRNDSLQALIRRNDACALDRYSRVRRGSTVPATAEGATLDASLDATQTSALRAGLVPVTTEGGVRVPRLTGAPWTPECTRQLNADRMGGVSLAPLVWQGGLPGLDDPRPMFVRDFGPRANRVLIDRFGDREPWVFTPVEPNGPPRMLEYEAGMALLWEGS